MNYPMPPLAPDEIEAAAMVLLDAKFSGVEPQSPALVHEAIFLGNPRVGGELRKAILLVLAGERRSFTASEIAKRSGLLANQVRNQLDLLVKCGLAVRCGTRGRAATWSWPVTADEAKLGGRYAID